MTSALKNYQKAKCRHCKKTFHANIYNVRKGFGKHCSKACSNRANNLGFKPGHPSHLTPESLRKISAAHSDEKHWNWKGDKAGKNAMHMWVVGKNGSPKRCQHCKTRSTKKTYDWANIDHTYKRLLNDYIRLCRSCHRKYDYRNNAYQHNRKHELTQNIH